MEDIYKKSISDGKFQKKFMLAHKTWSTINDYLTDQYVGLIMVLCKPH